MFICDCKRSRNHYTIFFHSHSRQHPPPPRSRSLGPAGTDTARVASLFTRMACQVLGIKILLTCINFAFDFSYIIDADNVKGSELKIRRRIIIAKCRVQMTSVVHPNVRPYYHHRLWTPCPHFPTSCTLLPFISERMIIGSLPNQISVHREFAAQWLCTSVINLDSFLRRYLQSI